MRHHPDPFTAKPRLRWGRIEQAVTRRGLPKLPWLPKLPKLKTYSSSVPALILSGLSKESQGRARRPQRKTNHQGQHHGHNLFRCKIGNMITLVLLRIILLVFLVAANAFFVA